MIISKRNLLIISHFLKDKNKKSWLQIFKEFSLLLIFQKKIPVHYITNLIFRKNVSNYRDYISLDEQNRVLEWSYSKANDQIKLVENKLLFEKLITKNNIKTPKIYFYNDKNKFIYQNDVFYIEVNSDFFSFLEKVFEDLNVETIFCKPIAGRQGNNIFVLKKGVFSKIEDRLFDLILSGSFIFQEVILQHEDLSKLNDSSINSLRIISYKNHKNEIEILSGFIRLGRKGLIIDNAHAGGIVVSFDKVTGKMREEGVQLLDNGGGVFYKHPDTELIFKDFQIPMYNQIEELVKKASFLFKFPILGWDIAVSKTGPIIIEVNHDCHLLLSDRMEKGLKNIPSFNRLLEQVKDI